MVPIKCINRFIPEKFDLFLCQTIIAANVAYISVRVAYISANIIACISVNFACITISIDYFSANIADISADTIDYVSVNGVSVSRPARIDYKPLARQIQISVTISLAPNQNEISRSSLNLTDVTRIALESHC